MAFYWARFPSLSHRLENFKHPTPLKLKKRQNIRAIKWNNGG
jgi:hypothetical protein